MMRQFLGCVLALALVSVAAADSKFTLNERNTKIDFTGTKPGGKHDGGFKKLSGTATVGDDPTSLQVNIEIDLKSTYTDTPKLTQHLMSPDFFGVQSNPKSKFVSKSVTKSGDAYEITGDLTLNGKTKSITFPAKVEAGP